MTIALIIAILILVPITIGVFFIGIIVMMLEAIISLGLLALMVAPISSSTIDPSILNVITTAILVVVTWWYAHQIEKRAQMDRNREEMDLLIAPLYANSQGWAKTFIFMKGVPAYAISKDPTMIQHTQFWDSIQRHKYLAPDYLRSAIDEYLRNKTPTVDDRTRGEDYERVEADLFSAIARRYEELSKMI